MKRSAGRAVTYHQGNTSVELTAWPERHSYEVLGEDGLLTEVDAFNWCCEAAELGLTPRAGDTLTDDGGDETVTYQVLPIGKLKCFQPLDTDGRSLLLRTVILK
jgi:hypothetical protein